MAEHPTHEEVEARMRALIAEAGLAEPDAVEHEPRAVVLLWHGPKVAVVIDLDEEGAPIVADAVADN